MSSSITSQSISCIRIVHSILLKVKPKPQGRELESVQEFEYDEEDDEEDDEDDTASEGDNLREELEEAPFEHGTETQIDMCIRHTWEIEPARYSPAGLSTGFKALKGKDSYLVAQLMPLAAEQEFFVGLANLTYQTGTADGDGGYGNYYKRRRGHGNKPAGNHYEGYMGNYSGEVEQSKSFI
ncbi:hypothetical protein EV368DRAFT_66197 [Lentinula lateritia]|nr:hypothetical protein EV368DRAFT_66197 [Lentinula lateritia]